MVWMNKNSHSPETAFINGKICTADAEKPEARAFLVRNGRFALVGSNEDVAGCPNQVDLQGKCVIPGLIDSHCHAFSGVAQASANMITLDPETKPEELGKTLLALSAGESFESGPLMAIGIRLTRGTFSASDIDCEICERPVLVFSDDGHALLLNTKAMEVLGIDRNTGDPNENSYFCRDASGEPTGLVIEIPAMMRCKSLIVAAESQDVDLKAILGEILHAYAAYGYTTLFEAMSTDDGQSQLFEALKEMDEADELPMRLSTSFGYHGEEYLSAEKALECMKELRQRFSSAHVFPETLKLFTDGTVEEHTALLFEPYADSPGNFGIQAEDPKELQHAAELAAREGFHIHIHALGDRAVSIALDSLCSLGETTGTKTIAHNQLYREEDVERISAAGDIFFQTTPQWVVSVDYTEKYLGPERYQKQFPFGTILRRGVVVSFGSDSCLDPVTANPFLGMYYAVARGDERLHTECFPPLSEGITRLDALRAYTINGAKQLGLEAETGSISEGKSADFVILDRDIMTCPLEELKETQTEETWFCGRRTE